MAMRLSLRLSEEPDSPQQSDCSMLSTTAATAAAHGSRGLTMLTCMDTESPTAAAAAAADGEAGEGDCDVNGAPIFNSKRAKLDYFSRDCTAITEYLYVGGKKVASSQEKLVEKGITHIINAAGDVCDNYFPHKFHYLKLHLLDSAQEDIMCVLYKVIDFIDVVRKGKNKVLVHCQQVRRTDSDRAHDCIPGAHPCHAPARLSLTPPSPRHVSSCVVVTCLRRVCLVRPCS